MKTTETIQEQLSSPNIVTKVTDWLRNNKSKGRYALVLYLCRLLDLCDRLGKPRLADVHKALRVLESRGFWKLPKVQSGIKDQYLPRRLKTRGCTSP